MKAAKMRILHSLLLAATAIGLVLGAAVWVAAAPAQAHAYTYLKTETSSIFNRHWIHANPSGYFEEIGADPHGPRAGMASWEAPGGWNGYVKGFRYQVYNATDARGWSEYYCTNGSWTRAGANFGHGGIDSANVAPNGAGFGCLATYGYAWSREGYFTGADGLDDLYYSHLWIEDTVWGTNYYSAADFWPRVKIVYDKNSTAAVSNLPGAHYKYIGNAGNVSSAKPTRTGYTFEGWSTYRNGPVNIASGQRIGYEDWNLKKPMTLAHGWSGGPTDVSDDLSAGIPSPTGTNVITLYAQWKPISYTVAYAGNGATAGVTASSSHVYDAAKALTANGFSRSYALTCDAQGGSAGNKTLMCVWNWKSWNTSAGGTGASYANRASVRNLRATTGATTLYAQWAAGGVVLPSPGTRAGYTFAGWYTAVSGGVLAGRAGASVSIAQTTTYYARWLPDAKVGYYVDGSSEPVFVETVPNGTVHRANAEASARGAKAGCAGFDGWYLDAACTRPYQGGSVVPDRGLNLYGRNKVELRYDLTDRTRALFADRVLYLDEELTRNTAAEALVPTLRTLYYGDRVSLERGRSVWFEERGRAREAVCEPGAYVASDAAVPVSGTLRLTGNTVVYLHWAVPAYDGIALS